MNKFAYVVEIEGSLLAYSSSYSSEAASAVSWATTIKESLRHPFPLSQSQEVNPFDGSFSYSGNEIRLASEEGILAARKETPITVLTQDLGKTDTEITVESTAGFPASGWVWVGREAIRYDAVTATTFGTGGTPAQRAQLGTFATEHSEEIGTSRQPNQVSGFNPIIIGRRAKVIRFNPEDGTDNKTTFLGVIDDFDFNDGGFFLRLLSHASIFEDAEVMTKKFARGIFLGAYFVGDSQPYQDLPPNAKNPKGGLNSINISLEDQDTPFPQPDVGAFYRINDEIFQYSTVESPAIDSTIQLEIDTHPNFGNFFDTNGRIETGDVIEFLADASPFQRPDRAIATRVSSAPGSSLALYRVYHTSQYDAVEGGAVSTPCRNLLSPLFRAELGTKQGEHKIGDDISEVRFVWANQVEAILQLILSQDGDQSNSKYDVLSSGWGAGIDQSFVDITAFEKLIPLTYERQYTFESAEPLMPRIRNLARITGARIFVNQSGVLTASLDREIYPDSQEVVTITNSDIGENTIPSWHPQMANVFNSWTFRGNAPKGSDYRDLAYFEDSLSVFRYRKRPLPDYEDKGITVARDGIKLELLAASVLRRWATPNPMIELVVAHETSESLKPGDLIRLQIPHLPDLKSGSGIDDFFELLSVVPSDSSASARLRLALMPPQGNTRLIAPAGEITGISGNDITLRAASLTRMAPPSGKAGIDSILSEDGTEDVHYFKSGQKVKIYDLSSMGVPPVSTFEAEITAVDYSLRKLTLDAVPGWPIVAGDIIKPAPYDTIEPVNPEYVDVFVFLASDTPDLDGDPAHLWGV